MCVTPLFEGQNWSCARCDISGTCRTRGILFLHVQWTLHSPPGHLYLGPEVWTQMQVFRGVEHRFEPVGQASLVEIALRSEPVDATSVEEMASRCEPMHTASMVEMALKCKPAYTASTVEIRWRWKPIDTSETGARPSCLRRGCGIYLTSTDCFCRARWHFVMGDDSR